MGWVELSISHASDLEQLEKTHEKLVDFDDLVIQMNRFSKILQKQFVELMDMNHR